MVERITPAQQQAVDEQRRLGRTDRQAEKIIGLPNGLLSRPHIVAEDDRPVRLFFSEGRSASRRHLAAIMDPDPTPSKASDET